MRIYLCIQLVLKKKEKKTRQTIIMSDHSQDVTSSIIIHELHIQSQPTSFYNFNTEKLNFNEYIYTVGYESLYIS